MRHWISHRVWIITIIKLNEKNTKSIRGIEGMESISALKKLFNLWNQQAMPLKKALWTPDYDRLARHPNKHKLDGVSPLMTDPPRINFTTLSPKKYIYIYVTCDKWHETCDTLIVTCDKWHVKCDTRREVNILSKL